jgi:hypothetical protein
MTIVEQRCPRCAIQHTVRFGHLGSYCFNCRFRWHASGCTTRVQSPMHFHVMEYPFGPAELTRLENYRAAVKAGFYNDWPVSESIERQPL